MKLIIVLLIVLIIILLYKQKETFIYKIIPVAKNSNYYKDIGILKNIRKDRSFYSIKNEYEYRQLNKILTKVITRTHLENLNYQVFH